MRLIADECCPAPVVEALRRAGHDVLYVLESHRGDTDREVVRRAGAEDRVLITEDYDFGELAIRDRLALPGLVILSFVGHGEPMRVERTVAVVADLAERLRDHITLIYPEGVRRRPLRPA